MLNLINYSEKAIAVTGDTKPVKDELKLMGGKFNGSLKVGPGWIFSKKKLPELQQFMTKTGNSIELQEPIISL